VWLGVPIDSMSDPKWTSLLEWSCVVGWESRIGLGEITGRKS
jgi:hypothetical protein